MGKTDSNNSNNNQKASVNVSYDPDLSAVKPLKSIIKTLKDADVIKLTEAKDREERIRQWVEMNIPNSPYKPHYVKAFKIVLSLEDPNSMKQVDVVEKVFDEFEPNFKKQSLRKRIRPFLNSFEVDK